MEALVPAKTHFSYEIRMYGAHHLITSSPPRIIRHPDLRAPRLASPLVARVRRSPYQLAAVAPSPRRRVLNRERIEAMSTDDAWVQWGKHDPYFAVITNPKYRRAQIDDEARREFFASGKNHARRILETCRTTLGLSQVPARILDFGCGVGRVALAFAEEPGVEEVVGLDVSPAMLEEARKNRDARGLDRVRFSQSSLPLREEPEAFDLVHSYIVFQHIDVPRGRRLFAELVKLLAPGGAGAVQVLIGKEYHASTYGQPTLPLGIVVPSPSWVRRARATLRLRTRFRHLTRLVGRRAERGAGEDLRAHGSEPVVDGHQRSQPSPRLGSASSSSPRDPEMQMNPYNLSELFFVLHEAGIETIHVELTNHSGEIGAFLYFVKPTKP